MSIKKRKELIVTLLDETARIIEPEIIRYTRTLNRDLQKIIDYGLKPKGNRERPLLVRLSCEAVGGKFVDIVPSAVAVELFHFSTLILDDIFDNAPRRGGVKSVFKAYGTRYAIIIAELINSFAFLALSDLYISLSGCSDRITEAIKLLKTAQRDLYYGQYLDLSFEHRESITEKQYFDMISKTTGFFISCVLQIGAILGSGQKEEIESLSKYGNALGKAFQIRDDIAEIIGDARIIGKQLGGDIKQGKMRLPLIKALSYSKGEDNKYLREIIRNKHNDKVNIMNCIKILIETGAVEYSKKIAHTFSLEAIAHVKSLSNTPAKHGLIAFAEVIGGLW